MVKVFNRRPGPSVLQYALDQKATAQSQTPLDADRQLFGIVIGDVASGAFQVVYAAATASQHPVDFFEAHARLIDRRVASGQKLAPYQQAVLDAIAEGKPVSGGALTAPNGGDALRLIAGTAIRDAAADLVEALKFWKPCGLLNKPADFTEVGQIRNLLNGMRLSQKRRDYWARINAEKAALSVDEEDDFDENTRAE